MLIRAACVFVGCLVAVLMGELAVRIFAPQDLSGSWYVAGPRGILMNRADGTARHAAGDRVAHYRFNRHHLRGGSVDPEAFKVLLLGDSFTFGWLLEEEDTFARHLERRATQEWPDRNIQFLNGGVGAWGIAEYLTFTEEFGPGFRPDAVLVFVNGYDVKRSQRRGFYTIEPTPESSPPRLLEHSLEGDALKWTFNSLPGYRFLLLHSHLLQLARREYRRMMSDRPRTPAEKEAAAKRWARLAEEGVALAEALFLRLAEWCEEHDARLWVATTGWMPWIEQLHTPGSTAPDEAFAQRAEEFFAGQGIPFFDLAPGVVATTGGDLSDYVIADGQHPNERGAALIAELAWPWVKGRLEEALGP